MLTPFRLALCALVLTSCTDVPDLGDSVRPALRNADYPDLVPIETLLALRESPSQAAEKLEQNLSGRIGRLKRRAAALQDPVIDAPSRERLQSGLVN
ncbi:MAG: hypothetical protein AB8B51_02955 [Sedimentitalea sp.]